ncbi:hypothetical protein JCM30204_31820 [Dysgonomonas termitidis]|jgi:hypothetical protein
MMQLSKNKETGTLQENNISSVLLSAVSQLAKNIETKKPGYPADRWNGSF